MQKVSTQFAPAMLMASPGCSWRQYNIGARRFSLLLEDCTETGSCVGGIV